MACPTGKIAHTNRESALTHVRDLEYQNHERGRDVESVGLSAFPCRNCRFWHVGRLHIPTVYHYTLPWDLHAMLDVGAIRPPRPPRVSRRKLRQLTGPQILIETVQETTPFVWFSWKDDWNLRAPGIPHLPYHWKKRDELELAGVRVFRLGVPASVATLRWEDYLRRNQPPRWMRDGLANYGTPTDWVATTLPVPLGMVRSIDTYRDGVWVDARTLDDDEDDASSLTR